MSQSMFKSWWMILQGEKRERSPLKERCFLHSTIKYSLFNSIFIPFGLQEIVAPALVNEFRGGEKDSGVQGHFSRQSTRQSLLFLVCKQEVDFDERQLFILMYYFNNITVFAAEKMFVALLLGDRSLFFMWCPFGNNATRCNKISDGMFLQSSCISSLVTNFI